MQAPEIQAPPKVTALIVSHNNAEALRTCLRALEASEKRESIEILVVDNGSWDESPRLDTEFPKATFVRVPRNFGTTKALNVGIRTAAGELILFLSPEVVVQPETASALAARLESTPEAAAVCPLLRRADGSVAVKSYRMASASDLFAVWRSDSGPKLVPVSAPEDSAPIEWVSLDALMVSKYFIKGLNYFDQRYGEFLADAELCYQIRRSAKKILLLGQVSATLQPSEPPGLSVGARALLSADFLSGVAVFAAKHRGFVAGWGYRVRAIFSALAAALSFRDAGYRWRRFMAVAGMRKVDGSQSELV